MCVWANFRQSATLYTVYFGGGNGRDCYTGNQFLRLEELVGALLFLHWSPRRFVSIHLQANMSTYREKSENLMNVGFSYQQAGKQQEEWPFLEVNKKSIPNWIHKFKGILYDKPKKAQKPVVTYEGEWHWKPVTWSAFHLSCLHPKQGNSIWHMVKFSNLNHIDRS